MVMEERREKGEACMEYLYQQLRAYAKSGYYGFHMPGHKRNAEMTGAELPYEIDITEIDGFDDLHHAQGILKRAQERAARVFHAEETHYLINGSTVGILSGILGSTRRGDKIAMARNCHKSVYNAVLMNELRPVYLYPEMIEGLDLNTEITVREVEEALEKDPDIKVVVMTSPTYDGVVSDIKGIAEAVHKRGALLIVDEAHGAHFGFHPYFPDNANQLGADIVIHSLHKTLPALTQTALLHMNGKLADRKRVRRYLHMLQSSSPSYVLMAGIDECVRILESEKEEIFGRYVSLLAKTRERLRGLKNLQLIETAAYDRSKIVISVDGCFGKNGNIEIKRFTGKDLYSLLNEKYLLQMEMSTVSYVVAMTSPADTEQGMERLALALEEIDGKLANNKKETKKYTKNAGESVKNEQNPLNAGNEQVYTPCQAEEEGRIRGQERAGFTECEGRVALEYAYVYPPGIPLVVPGERISAKTAACLRKYEDARFRIEGTETQGKIEVLADG